MSKYSPELKRIIASEYIDDGISSHQLDAKYAIDSRQIRYWGQVYTIHGERAFERSSLPRTAKFKLEALTLMWTKQWSLAHTSAQLNLSSSGILSTWLKRYNEEGMNGLKRCIRGRPPMKKRVVKPADEMTLEELKRELAYLRAENDVLKKYQELDRLKLARKKR
ncbi:helix-turn-helix domain-containing protein [Parendozoicomonas haliclonae]|uniref:Insertion element IS150 protein InsJ-like helix-turn-helix domain-containing protein n=1 Tax=Parendozoicomonas haliclonae TaxID=1960125 RepID=A0A1X7ARP7_9GAMM|nr:helix-turn-helix domain-containing protein [Parendozoicomonas haliclonae]SMA50984.1 hypothetical protein EHSB41UT_04807 [Parendozoicomonas haliclonae]